MKNGRYVWYCLTILLTGLIYSSAHAQQKNPAKDVAYQLDVRKSKLLWEAPRYKHSGFILFNSGSLSNIVNDWPTQGTFSINMNSMRSTSESTPAKTKKVDNELRSPGFFDVSKYPAATMVVKKIVAQVNGTGYKISGELTIKNVTKPIEFTATMKQKGSTITAVANMNISRANWNINLQKKPDTWNPFNVVKNQLIENDIPISLQLVFTKK
jgi:hypothetical protein